MTRGLGGSCREGFGAFKGFERFEGWQNGRLERPKNRGLCSGGKRQAAALEQQRLMTRGLGGSCREGFGAFLRVLSV